jgi:diaminopimelate epimerase
MNLAFHKMHGAGNDFMVLDARAAPVALAPARIRALGDRRRGVGWDQLIVLHASPGADVAMRIFNPDGTESGTCGNATRCVADLLGRETGRTEICIETRAGLLPAERLADGQVRVDMGMPGLGWQEIPLAAPADTLHLPLPGEPAAASMGNPHATFFLAEPGAMDPRTHGPVFERDPLFAEGANIGFAYVEAPDRLRLRVWERGAGLTLACGSGACAALVNAHRRGLTGRRATIAMDGGELVVEWAADGHVLMTGPTVTAFEGLIDLELYPA